MRVCEFINNLLIPKRLIDFRVHLLVMDLELTLFISDLGRVRRGSREHDMNEILLFVLCPHSGDLPAIKVDLRIVVDCGFVEDVVEHASDEVFLFDADRSDVEVLDRNHVLVANYHDVNVDFWNQQVGGGVVFEMMVHFLVIHDNRGHACVHFVFWKFFGLLFL